MTGVEFYRGPSLLTGDPVVAVATGLDGRSLNAKTGPMVQVWILRADLPPMDAKRQNIDDAICGGCRHRGHDGIGSSCYVVPWLAPNNVYKHLGKYPRASWPDLRRLLTAQHVRLGAYGDPAALPFEVWRVVLATVAGWTGYTHQWATCDPRLRDVLMASVDDLDEFCQAREAGWRTFRVRGATDPLVAAVETVCPASVEAGHRLTCQVCELCRGQANPARSVAIVAHGNVSATMNFYRQRQEGV
jgi:hypothetical protein